MVSIGDKDEYNKKTFKARLEFEAFAKEDMRRFLRGAMLQEVISNIKYNKEERHCMEMFDSLEVTEFKAE